MTNYIQWQNYKVRNKKKEFKYLHILLKNNVKFLHTKRTHTIFKTKKRYRNKQQLQNNTISDRNLHFLKINLKKTNKTINKALNIRNILNLLQMKTNKRIQIIMQIFMKSILN